MILGQPLLLAPRHQCEYGWPPTPCSSYAGNGLMSGPLPDDLLPIGWKPGYLSRLWGLCWSRYRGDNRQVRALAWC